MIPSTRSLIELLNKLVGFETEPFLYIIALLAVSAFIAFVFMQIGGVL